MSSTLIINNSGLFTHQGIQELFYKNNIADVSEVTILPEFVQGQLINRAYIQVEAWHESEAAFNFIKEMQSKRGAIISDDEYENFCIVKTNKTNKTNQKQNNQKTTNQKQNNQKTTNQKTTNQSKYTRHFQSISKQILNAQIQEYEAELEQEMQQLERESKIQIDIAIPVY
jgi:hypothetical protein